ncbi:hypothetical protein ACOSP7_013407 [Xanthoceras sorbifolium]
MASDVISPYITTICCFFFFFFLLIFVRSTEAEKLPHNITVRNAAAAAINTNNMELAAKTTTKQALANAKATTTTTTTDHHHDHLPLMTRKRGRFRTQKSPLMPQQAQQQRIFNTSAHEVPSGPNPISNR